MAEQPPTQNCENCRYYQMAARYFNADGSVRYQDTTMVCKRGPVAQRHSSPQHLGMGFSFVHPEQWCGEWAPGNPETVDDGAATMARLVLLGDLTAARALADKLRE